jgi:predicted TIM-barrel fold metal-dependent hydrolase
LVPIAGEQPDHQEILMTASTAVATGSGTAPLKLWANSGDSHFLEPEGLWRDRLPARLAELVPRAEKDPDGKWETVYVDGQAFRRRLPSIAQEEFFNASMRAPGSGDVEKRLPDLNGEGIWSELVFPSLGMWASSFRTPEVLREAMRASNDWARETILDYSPRLIPTAQVSTLDIGDAVAELERCGGMGFKAVFLTVAPHPQSPDYNRDEWEPFWAAAEDIGMVISFHIGTEPIDMSTGAMIGAYYRGPGGAVLNYTETTFGGQRAVMKLVASGALDRHPNLKVLVSEGGATWVPFIADRMEEGYRQHSMAVRPKLNRSPREIIYSQVYASFQHDKSAVAAVQSMGYHNVMWGSDYPHMEGTYGHTQMTLHHLFDDIDLKTRDRIMYGAFNELFPDAPLPPAPGTEVPMYAKDLH